jgi:hypothetical protein
MDLIVLLVHLDPWRPPSEAVEDSGGVFENLPMRAMMMPFFICRSNRFVASLIWIDDDDDGVVWTLEQQRDPNKDIHNTLSSCNGFGGVR